MKDVIAEEARKDEEVSYVYFVYGVVPEFMPHTAFRREKHFKTAGQKIIKCPYCQKTFTTIEQTEKVELYKHSRKAQVMYHDTMACKTCHRLVGIIYAVRQPA
jgi:transposase-like protein